MNMTLQDRSFYFKGLLLLTRKDHIIADEEKALLLHLGALLQFNRDFCENTIRDVLNNPHFDEKPPLFSNRECAEMFLQDGIKMAFADNNLHKDEFEWMREIALRNNISSDWLSARLADFLNDHKIGERPVFKIETFTNQQITVLPGTV